MHLRQFVLVPASVLCVLALLFSQMCVHGAHRRTLHSIHWVNGCSCCDG